MADRIRSNPIACDGHGLCAELAPELFRLDDWGYPVLERQPDTPELEAHAQRAASACPVLAIALDRR